MDQIRIKELSFENALQELEVIVRKLEEGNTPLEEAIIAYEQGIALKNHCEEKLKTARARIDKILTTNTSDLAVEPFDEEAEEVSS